MGGRLLIAALALAGCYRSHDLSDGGVVASRRDAGGPPALACDGTSSNAICIESFGIGAPPECPAGGALTRVSECPATNPVARCEVGMTGTSIRVWFYPPVGVAEARSSCEMSSGVFTEL